MSAKLTCICQIVTGKLRSLLPDRFLSPLTEWQFTFLRSKILTPTQILKRWVIHAQSGRFTRQTLENCIIRLFFILFLLTKVCSTQDCKGTWRDLLPSGLVAHSVEHLSCCWFLSLQIIRPCYVITLMFFFFLALQLVAVKTVPKAAPRGEKVSPRKPSSKCDFWPSPPQKKFMINQSRTFFQGPWAIRNTGAELELRIFCQETCWWGVNALSREWWREKWASENYRSAVVKTTGNEHAFFFSHVALAKFLANKRKHYGNVHKSRCFSQMFSRCRSR